MYGTHGTTATETVQVRETENRRNRNTIQRQARIRDTMYKKLKNLTQIWTEFMEKIKKVTKENE
jgi:chemotaxis regulatin CheY-phosphate phosphatase CheZ